MKREKLVNYQFINLFRAIIQLKKTIFFSWIILISPLAFSQSDFPKKPITFYVATGAGSSTDSIARIVAAKLTENLGWNIVVENKIGASGNIASVYIKRANPDGYSILVHSVSFAINPSIYKNAGYDAINDFEAIAIGASSPNVIGINTSLPVNNLKELVVYSKKEKLSYSSSGIGTTTHLTIERFKNMVGADFVHVPYQPAQAVGATVAGHTQISSTSMPPTVQFIKSGKLKAFNADKNSVYNLFNRIEVDGDGNCLFHAVYYYLNKILEENKITSSSELRESVCQFYNYLYENKYQTWTLQAEIQEKLKQ